MKGLSFFIFNFVFLVSSTFGARIEVGSKIFTESYILAEIIAQTIEEQGLKNVSVRRRLGLGATGILFEAVKTGDLDLYPDYTGTIAQAILKKPELKDPDEIRAELRKIGLSISDPIGFNNTYAFAMKKEMAEKYGIKKISDLVGHPEIRMGFTYEYMERADGWHAIAKFYGLPQKSVKAMEHALAYTAIRDGSIDLMDAYATDAKLKSLGLITLQDDKNFFPQYNAVIVTNLAFIEEHPKIWKALNSTLVSKIDEEEMISLNAIVDEDKKEVAIAARSFLSDSTEGVHNTRADFIMWSRLWKKTKEHLGLVLIALALSVIVGIPLGILAARARWLAQIILAASGVLQTIPSLALLGFLIPLFGIGFVPSIIALFLYGLLPIVRNTYLGVVSIDHELGELSEVIGIRGQKKILWIELPLASMSIFAGIKTSAVISVGTATLAAFIGAGGYGEFILTGLTMIDTKIILHGAIPAALLALIIQWAFDLTEGFIVPKGLRIKVNSENS